MNYRAVLPRANVAIKIRSRRIEKVCYFPLKEWRKRRENTFFLSPPQRNIRWIISFFPVPFHCSWSAIHIIIHLVLEPTLCLRIVYVCRMKAAASWIFYGYIFIHYVPDPFLLIEIWIIFLIEIYCFCSCNWLYNIQYMLWLYKKCMNYEGMYMRNETWATFHTISHNHFELRQFDRNHWFP